MEISVTTILAIIGGNTTAIGLLIGVVALIVRRRNGQEHVRLAVLEEQIASHLQSFPWTKEKMEELSRDVVSIKVDVAKVKQELSELRRRS